ncbi:MAG: MATE family efflux transporter [Rikenellaceae bacterium]|jgi:putative MATE family efflux protein|nr:MATE family efflux transporter [Rikenellaceae bacterium]
MEVSYKKIGTIAYPILISLLMEYLIGLTDTAFLGRVGEVELGASALGGVFFTALFVVGIGFSIGAQIMIARRNGERRLGKIGAILQQGLIFSVVIAGAMIALSKAFAPSLLERTIQSEAIFRATVRYLDWRIWGLLFAFVSMMFRAFYVGTTNTRIMTLNSVVMVLSNVALNYALIFGRFGFPRMGIAGAAIASTFAEGVSMLFYILYTRFRLDWRRYKLFSWAGFRPKLLGQMLGLSGFMMIQQFLAVGTWFIFFLAIEHQGERPLAVTNLVRSLSSVIFLTVNAFASTTNTLVGNLMGAGSTKQVLPTVWKCAKFSYLCVLPLLVLMAVIPGYVLRVYTNNWELIAASVPSLWVMASAYLLSTPGFVYFNAIAGTGNTRQAMWIEIATLCIYMVFVGYVVVYKSANVAVCWSSEHVYGGFLFLFSYLYLKRAKWQTKEV